MTENRILSEARRRLDELEAERLSPRASLSKDAVRRRPEENIESGHRQNYALDADRVLHSLAYTRYIDKTQVFSLISNDHISHRVLHVQLVSKIGRTVGRYLGLNEDLIEAIALAHDIGHPPFGHDGERFLSKKCQEHGLGPFMHNLQSVHFLEKAEKEGKGLNLSLQVLDGVLCHDGEVHASRLAPQGDKDFAALDGELAAKRVDPGLGLVPMTLEGCVVRMADTMAYIGRDLEDAIVLGLVGREDVPPEVTEILGNTNGTIVYRLVEDLIAGSMDEEAVGFSRPVAEALARLKQFNYRRIYLNPAIKTQHPKIEKAFDLLFEAFVRDVSREKKQSPVFRDFLDQMATPYREAHGPAEITRDFMSGMTDEYFVGCVEELLVPQWLPAGLGVKSAGYDIQGGASD